MKLFCFVVNRSGIHIHNCRQVQCLHYFIGSFYSFEITFVLSFVFCVEHGVSFIDNYRNLLVSLISFIIWFLFVNEVVKGENTELNTGIQKLTESGLEYLTEFCD